MTKFSVTYEIVTPQSAADGDVEDRGYVGQDLSLRDAIEMVCATRTSWVDGVECIEANYTGASFSWITVINGTEFETGAQESRSLHIPSEVTPSSRRRILSLLR